MNDESFKERAERYKQQMMTAYSSRAAETRSEPPGKQSDTAVQKPDDTALIRSEAAQTDTRDTSDKEGERALEPAAEEIDERFPDPVLPDFIKANNTESIKPDEQAYGYLKINVRTGNGGLPLGGNSVMVTETVDGKENLVKMLVTDTSGETGTLRLPTVKSSGGSEPDDYTGASLYNISVGTDGYFNEVSRGVAVFEGITSIQTFYMTPEPFDYTTDESIIYDNTEPLI